MCSVRDAHNSNPNLILMMVKRFYSSSIVLSLYNSPIQLVHMHTRLFHTLGNTQHYLPMRRDPPSRLLKDTYRVFDERTIFHDG